MFFRLFHGISKFESEIKDKKVQELGSNSSSINQTGTVGTGLKVTVSKVLHDPKNWEFWTELRWNFQPFSHSSWSRHRPNAKMTSKTMISPIISPQKVPGIFVHILNRKISVLVSTSFPTCLTNWATLTSDYNNFNEPNKKLPRVQLMGQVQIGRSWFKVDDLFDFWT